MAKAPDRIEQYPRAFGKYRILKPLAAGGMGAVYLAVAGVEGMEKLLAIKVVRPHLTDAEFVRRFEDEAKVVVRLDHGNLVQVFEVGDVDGQMYMAMEYVDGRDLRAVWNRCVEKRVAFPLDVVVHVIKDALRGLSYAHEYGGLDLVHRDVSPPNLLVSFAGQTKVADFGLALSNLKMQKTAPGLVFGKVSYMAPEQARGDRVDHRADLYALGIIFWELLTGRRLFPSGDNQAEDLVARSRGPVVDAPSRACARVPEELDDLVLRALAPRPEDRFSSASQMLRSLAEVQADLWPDLDTDRVSTFMHLLYGDRIEMERGQIQDLVARSRNIEEAGDSGRVKVTVSGADPVPLLGGRYRLGRMLGEGAMGQVFEAEHIDIGRRVAIKVLHRAHANTEAAVERFRREARAATRIHHRAIVEVLDFGTTDDGRCYYVMELLSGASLGDLITDDAPLELERALGIGVQMCGALQAAHEAGVIHRDLKPGNILITRDDEGSEIVKILDFGIAKWVDAPLGAQAKLTYGSVGTPKYMAPEQAMGGKVDRRSDIYAIGIILYEMLTKQNPFGDGLPQEMLARKLQRPAMDIMQFRPDLPQGLAATIMATIEKEPERRPATAAELQGKLGRYMAGGRTQSHSSVAPWTDPAAVGTELVEPQSRNFSGRLPWIPIFGGLLFVLLAGLLFFWAPWKSGAATGPPGRDDNDSKGPTEGARPALASSSRRVVARGAIAQRPADAGRPEEPTGVGSARPAHDRLLDGASQRAASLQVSSRHRGSVVVRRNTGAIRRSSGPVMDPSRTGKSRNPGPSRAAAPRPVSAASLLKQARTAMSAGLYGRATKLLARAERLPGGRTRALTMKAALLLRQGRYRQAVRVADRAIKAGAGIGARLTMARAYRHLGLYRSAAAQYRIVLTRHPNHRSAKAGLAAVSKHL